MSTRRLPVYLLLDTSGSMQGEPIHAVNVGLQAGSEPMAEIVDRYLPALLRLQDEVRKLVI